MGTQLVSMLTVGLWGWFRETYFGTDAHILASIRQIFIYLPQRMNPTDFNDPQRDRPLAPSWSWTFLCFLWNVLKNGGLFTITVGTDIQGLQRMMTRDDFVDALSFHLVLLMELLWALVQTFMFSKESIVTTLLSFSLVQSFRWHFCFSACWFITRQHQLMLPTSLHWTGKCLHAKHEHDKQHLLNIISMLTWAC